VQNSGNKLLQDRELLEKLKKSKKRENELLTKILLLEEENKKIRDSRTIKDIQRKKAIKNQYRDIAQGLTAVELTDQAMKLLYDGSTYQALDYTNRAIRLDRNYSLAFGIRGAVYLILGRIDQSFDDFTKAISLDQEYAPYYTIRGAVYWRSGFYKLAMEDYNKAISLWPDYHYTYGSRGIAYAESGQLDRACDDWKRACDLGDQESCKRLTDARNLSNCP